MIHSEEAREILASTWMARCASKVASLSRGIEHSRVWPEGHVVVSPSTAARSAGVRHRILHPHAMQEFSMLPRPTGVIFMDCWFFHLSALLC